MAPPTLASLKNHTVRQPATVQTAYVDPPLPEPHTSSERHHPASTTPRQELPTNYRPSNALLLRTRKGPPNRQANRVHHRRRTHDHASRHRTHHLDSTPETRSPSHNREKPGIPPSLIEPPHLATCKKTPALARAGRGNDDTVPVYVPSTISARLEGQSQNHGVPNGGQCQQALPTHVASHSSPKALTHREQCHHRSPRRNVPAN